MEQEQESRTERISLAVTPSELELVKLVALVNKTDSSNLLRGRSLVDVLTEGARIAKRLRESAA